MREIEDYEIEMAMRKKKKGAEKIESKVVAELQQL